MYHWLYESLVTELCPIGRCTVADAKQIMFFLEIKLNQKHSVHWLAFNFSLVNIQKMPGGDYS